MAMKRKETDWSLLLLVVVIPMMAVLVLLIQTFPIPPPHFPNPSGGSSDPNLFFFTFLFLPFFVAIVLFCYMQVKEITSRRPH